MTIIHQWNQVHCQFDWNSPSKMRPRKARIGPATIGE